MSTTTIKTGWLNDNEGKKFAPKTLTSQVQTSDGTLLEEKIQRDIDAAKEDILKDVSIDVDDALSDTSVNPVQNKVINAELDLVSDTLDSHIKNTNIHVGTDDRSNWNTAYTHSQSAHARTDATNVTDSTTNGNILIDGTETNVYFHPNSDVSAGTYKSVTVDEQGHVINGSNPTTLAGYGITDAEPKNAVSNHNTSTDAHDDIRLLITELTNRLNTVANSTNIDLDQLGEIVAYIENNKSLIDGITTNKVNVADIINNLTTNVSDKPLSAAQGVAIKGIIDDLQSALDTHEGNTTKHITSTERTNWNAAKTHADLAHAPSNAQPNQNAFSNIKVDDTIIAADTATDTLELVGSNVTITPDVTNDKVTIAVADASTTTKGIVQLTDSISSDSTTTAATPKSVMRVYNMTDARCTEMEAFMADKADSVHEHSISDIAGLSTKLALRVPITRTINGQALSSDITLTAEDLGISGGSSDPNAMSATNPTGTGYLSINRLSGSIVGENSVAVGTSTEASGINSHAEGHLSKATGESSHAEGHGVLDTTTTPHTYYCNTASGIGSHAEGYLTKASGDYSHAEGCGWVDDEDGTIYYNEAAGESSHVEGSMTTASALCSHAEGEGTTANGDFSHAEGRATTASGDGSHAEGLLTKALTTGCHSEGYYAIANGQGSHAEGGQTMTYASRAHAEGSSTTLPQKTIKTATNKDIEDKNVTITNSEIETAWNIKKNFSLACGEASHVEGKDCLTFGEASHAEGSTTQAKGNYSHAEGNNTIASEQCSHAEGRNTTASGQCSHAEGAATTASGGASHAEGNMATAYGSYSHAEGGSANKASNILSINNSTTDSIISAWNSNKFSLAYGFGSHVSGQDCLALGSVSHAEGNETTASGQGSHAEGSGTTASGNYSHAEGYKTTASGYYSHAEGNFTTASGYWSHAEGHSTTALDNQHAQGHCNNTVTATAGTSTGTGTGTAFVIGNGTGTSASNAFRVDYNGKPYAKSSLTTSGCDYAEYFEWQDLNLNSEDRRGYFVTLDEDKIKIAQPDDYILGIISGQPSVIGNGDEDWMGRYVFDEFGAFVYEDFEYEEEMPETVIDEETGESSIVMKTVTKTGKKYKENPNYDPSIEYVQREDRPEWDAVGMLGVLSVRDDGTCQVNGYCKVADGGIATASESGYRVIKRVSDNIVKVVFR